MTASPIAAEMLALLHVRGIGLPTLLKIAKSPEWRATPALGRQAALGQSHAPSSAARVEPDARMHHDLDRRRACIHPNVCGTHHGDWYCWYAPLSEQMFYTAQDGTLHGE